MAQAGTQLNHQDGSGAGGPEAEAAGFPSVPFKNKGDACASWNFYCCSNLS